MVYHSAQNYGMYGQLPYIFAIGPFGIILFGIFVLIRPLKPLYNAHPEGFSIYWSQDRIRTYDNATIQDVIGLFHITHYLTMFVFSSSLPVVPVG